MCNLFQVCSLQVKILDNRACLQKQFLFLFFSFFLRGFFFSVIEKSIYREMKIQRKRPLVFNLLGATARASQEPGTPSGSPMQMQGPKASCDPRLLSWAASWELVRKWRSLDTNRHLDGILAHIRWGNNH